MQRRSCAASATAIRFICPPALPRSAATVISTEYSRPIIAAPIGATGSTKTVSSAPARRSRTLQRIPPVHSALYSGWVRHRRYAPTAHEFQYRLFMMYLDLAELPEIFAPYWLWSARRPALARFRRADY